MKRFWLTLFSPELLDAFINNPLKHELLLDLWDCRKCIRKLGGNYFEIGCSRFVGIALYKYDNEVVVIKNGNALFATEWNKLLDYLK